MRNPILSRLLGVFQSFTDFPWVSSCSCLSSGLAFRYYHGRSLGFHFGDDTVTTGRVSVWARISKRTVDALIASGAPGEVKRDDDVKGFAVRLNANGSISYLAEFRAGRGRAFPVRRVVLGRHGQLTPDQARNLAKNMLARVLAGDDPAAERANRRRERTVADLLRHTLATHGG